MLLRLYGAPPALLPDVYIEVELPALALWASVPDPVAPELCPTALLCVAAQLCRAGGYIDAEEDAELPPGIDPGCDCAGCTCGPIELEVEGREDEDEATAALAAPAVAATAMPASRGVSEGLRRCCGG